MVPLIEVKVIVLNPVVWGHYAKCIAAYLGKTFCAYICMPVWHCARCMAILQYYKKDCLSPMQWKCNNVENGGIMIFHYSLWYITELGGSRQMQDVRTEHGMM